MTLRRRTPEEKRAYMQGYLAALNQCVRCITRYPENPDKSLEHIDNQRKLVELQLESEHEAP